MWLYHYILVLLLLLLLLHVTPQQATAFMRITHTINQCMIIIAIVHRFIEH